MMEDKRTRPSTSAPEVVEQHRKLDEYYFVRGGQQIEASNQLNRDLDYLRRVEAAGGEAYMRSNETSSTMRLSDLGLLRWWQSSAFVARVAITDAGREFLKEER